MSRRLTLHPTAAAAAQAVAIAEGPAFLPGDLHHSFGAFVRDLARLAQPLEVPGAAARLALARVASDRAGSRVRATPAALARTLTDLHASGLSPAELGRLGDAGRDLGRLLDAHLALLRVRGLADVGMLPWVAQAGLDRLALPDAIAVAPRPDWTQGELSLLGALGQRLPVEVAFPEEAPGFPIELLAHFEAPHQELAREGHCRTVEAGFLIPGIASLQAWSHATPAAEARHVAAAARRLLREGVAPDAIAVTALGPVGPEVFAALEAAGIPIGPPPRSALETLAAQVAVDLLALAEEGVPRERLCALLETRLLSLPGGGRWARLLRAAGSGDHRSGRLLAPLRALLARGDEKAPTDLWELEEVVAAISSLPARASPAVFARALWHLFGRLGLRTRLASRPRDRSLPVRGQLDLFGEVGATNAPAFAPAFVEVAHAEAVSGLHTLEAVLSDLAGLASRTGASSDPPSGARGDDLGLWSLADLTGCLTSALAATPARQAPPLPGGVVVASGEALNGCHFSHVFLVQLSGEPAAGGDDPLLPEPLRRRAREQLERPALFPLAGQAARARRQRLALWAASALASEALSASGSRTDGVRPLAPSPLLNELASWSPAGLRAVSTEAGLPFAVRPTDSSLTPWLTEDEVVAARPTHPELAAAEPELAQRYRALAEMREGRKASVLGRRVDAYAGDLTAADLSTALASALTFGAERPLSASSLERLAGCGFRALGQLVFRLRSPDERDESLHPRDRGKLLHAGLEHGFRALAAHGLLPLQGRARRTAETEVFLLAVREQLDAFEAREEGGHPGVWAAQRKAAERELLRVLRAEQRRADGFVPAEFELALGRDREAPLLAIASGDVRLGGRVDCMDRLSTGHGLRVVDYKSGALDLKDRRIRREFAGREVQLGHYALAFSLLEPGAVVDAAFYSVRDAEYSTTLAEACEEAGVSLAVFLDARPEGRASARAAGTPNLPNRIEDALGEARAGRFPVAPGDCRYCELRGACRVGGLHEEWE